MAEVTTRVRRWQSTTGYRFRWRCRCGAWMGSSNQAVRDMVADQHEQRCDGTPIPKQVEWDD